MESIRVEGWLPATPQQLYIAFLDPKQHSAMTGAEATGNGVVGGEMTAWDGYIRGRYTLLRPAERIEMSWRTSEFADSDPDSKLVIVLEAQGDGCGVTFEHSGIPDGQGAAYEQGWVDFYLAPMQAWLDDDG